MKNKIKKIGAFVCALIVFASCFVVENYIADDNGVVHVDFQDYLSACGLPQIVDCDSNSRFVLWDEVITKGKTPSEDYGRINVLEIISGDISVFLNGSNGLKYGFTASSYMRVHRLVYNSNSIAPVWESGSIVECAETVPKYIFNGAPINAKLYYTDFDIYTDSSVTDIAYAFNTFQVFDVGVVDSKPIVFDKYNSSLGYLNNARIETTFLTTDHGKEVDYSSFRKTLKFDKLSTTGIDLSCGDYVIRVYGQMCYQKTTTDEIYDDNFPIIYFGDFEIGNSSISYNSQDLFDLVSSSTDDPYSVWDIWTKTIHRSDITYYQIYNKNTHEYGGYLKVVLGGAEGSMYSQTTLKEDMSVDSEGFEDKNLIGSAGSGTTYEDAEINADKNYNDLMNNGGVQGLEGAINAFTSTLGVVPQAIGSVFSFLPSWCHDYIGLCFALLVALIVWKFLRG